VVLFVEGRGLWLEIRLCFFYSGGLWGGVGGGGPFSERGDPEMRIREGTKKKTSSARFSCQAGKGASFFEKEVP